MSSFSRKLVWSDLCYFQTACFRTIRTSPYSLKLEGPLVLYICLLLSARNEKFMKNIFDELDFVKDSSDGLLALKHLEISLSCTLNLKFLQFLNLDF